MRRSLGAIAFASLLAGCTHTINVRAEEPITINLNIKIEHEIRIKVGLDDKNMPVRISWDADDNPSGETTQDSKAMLISLFDREHLETVKIDLWVKDMQVGEMDRFVFQTLRGMADTYFRATQNAEMARDMQLFVQYFGEQTKVIPKEEQ